MAIKRIIDGKEVLIELTYYEKMELQHEWFRDQVLCGIEDLRENKDFFDEEPTPEEYDALVADADELADELEEHYIRNNFDSGGFSELVFDFLLGEIDDRRV